MTPILAILAMVSCKTEETPIKPPIGVLVEDAQEAVSVQLAHGVGNAPLRVIARANNRFGASVASVDQAFDVNGTAVGVSFDGLGYGTLEIAEAGTQSIDDGIDSWTAHALDSDWPGFGATRIFQAPVTDSTMTAGLTSGAAVVQGNELFYVGTDQSVHRVLGADGQIRGIESGHLDVDGVKDAVIWTDNHVFLMRGRLGGGLAWGTAYTSPQHTVGGAALGELTGDNLTDVVIGWAALDGSSSVMDVYHGNGLFEFEAAEPRNLASKPISISIGDATGEGTAQITVLNEEGTWSRFISGSPDRYMPIGPRTPLDINVPLGSTLLAKGDINADSGDELYFLGPLNPSGPRSVVVVDLLGQKISFLSLSLLGAYADIADLDGNGLVELVTLQSTENLNALIFDQTSNNTYLPSVVELIQQHAPIDLDDNILMDGVPDLFVASHPWWWWWKGANDPSDSEVFWERVDLENEVVGSSIGPIATPDLDGDRATTEVIGFAEQNGDTALVIWQADPAVDGVQEVGSVLLSTVGADPLDISVCGTDAFVVLSGEAFVVDVSNPSAPSVSSSTTSAGTRIDCGDAPNGAVAGVLANDLVQLINISLGQIDTVSAPGAKDVAVGDLGSGAEVVTCESDGCSAEFWPWGETESSFAVTSNGTLQFISATETLQATGSGELSVYDVDGNGRPDLIATGSDGSVAVYRSNGGISTLAEGYSIVAPALGPVGVGDADGDGHADLWVVNSQDNSLLHTRQPGYATPSTETSTETPSTGDTGQATTSGGTGTTFGGTGP